MKMYFEFIKKQNVSGSSINMWRPACLVVFLALALLPGITIAVSSPVGTWQGTWTSGGLNGQAFNWVVQLDGSISGDWEEPLEPWGLSGTATLSVSGTYTYNSGTGWMVINASGWNSVQGYDVYVDTDITGTFTGNSASGNSSTYYSVYQNSVLVDSDSDTGTWQANRTAIPEEPPTLLSVTDAGNATADVTWQLPTNTPQYNVGFAFDIYTGQWVTDFSGSGMWYWFDGTDQSGQMNLGRSGAYFVWISSMYNGGGFYPCNNPQPVIIYSGQPHQPINVTATNLGSRQVKVGWKPDYYGTWIYWLIAYKMDAPNQGWVLVNGPLGNSYWHYTSYGASEATLTMPYDGDYWVFLFAYSWYGQWGEAAAVSASTTGG